MLKWIMAICRLVIKTIYDFLSKNYFFWIINKSADLRAQTSVYRALEIISFSWTFMFKTNISKLTLTMLKCKFYSTVLCKAYMEERISLHLKL